MKLNIFMVIPGLAISSTILERKSLGGSETAGICLAREFVKKGHAVSIFANLEDREHEGADGITYVNIQRAQDIISKIPHDVLIVQRNPMIFGGHTNSKINILWNHDLATQSMLNSHLGAMWNIDWIYLLTQFHIDQTKSVYSFLKDDTIRKSKNGINLDMFSDLPRREKTLMYCARPERGLINLVGPGGIMEQLLEKDPEIHLYVAGYDNTTQDMAAFYNYLWGRCEQLPNVTRLGALTKDQLYQQYAQTKLYLYPTEFEEISCISAMECMAAGVPMITSACGALPETLSRDCAVMLDGKPESKSYQERFVKEVISLLNDNDRWQKMSDAGKDRAKGFTWESVAVQWLADIFKYFNEQTSDKHKLIRHFETYEDIITARKIADKYNLHDISARIKKDYKWVYKPDSYEYRYNKQADLEYKNVPIKAVVERFVNEFQKGIGVGLRWPNTYDWFNRHYHGKSVDVLDYACNIGYFSAGIAALGHNVTGIDIADAAIDTARQFMAAIKMDDRVKIFHAKNTEWSSKEYDVIFLGEILEHVLDPVQFLTEIESHLKPDGHILITTPYGPAGELDGRRLVPGMHIHHYEYADLEDMFKGKKEFISELVYWTHTLHSQKAVGWYLTSFRKSGEYGHIDMSRKELIQMPDQELSVCMIVKNNETTLAKCLNSVKNIADEIIVCDTGSTDRTKEIAKEFGAVIIEGSNPLEKGFETSRNESIVPASKDWILWIDDDEEMQQPQNLKKYLRRSNFDGYRIRQHHFAVQPQKYVDIDIPVRLFRNHRGVKFYGLIHEHPETAINEGVGEVLELADVDLAHGGYLTEAVRKHRFWRNIPLMVADINKYPHRILGKWLYMRDLCHLVIWALEQTGRLNEESIQRCHEVIQIYRSNFLTAGGHFMYDGLQYYGTALKFLGRGAEFQYSLDLHNGRPPEMRVNRFDSILDFSLFMKKLIEERSMSAAGKYLK